MLRHSGNGFGKGKTTARDGPAITATGANMTINERIADGVHVALVNREGGFPVAYASRGRVLMAVDAAIAECGERATRRLLLQAARALR
jgi:hypothetical protein